MQTIFETERLLLRQFTEADAPLILKLNSDPEVIKYVHEPVLTSESAARDIILQVILPQYKNNLGRWAMFTKSGDDFVGWCGLKSIKETGEIDLGYRIIQKAWGNGYATEAAKQTLKYGFNTLALKIITGKAQVENTVSIKVLQKIGMNFIRKEMENGYAIKIFTATKEDIC